MARSDINQVILEGNVTRDVELKFLPSGTPVAEFGIAVNESKKDDSQPTGWASIPNFVDVTAWEKLAENVASSIGKGDRVVIIGRLKMDSWEDKETGQKRSKIRVVAENVTPSLRWATAEVTKNPKGTGGGHSISEEELAEFING
jgi:single-strand DNA-binding protein